MSSFREQSTKSLGPCCGRDVATIRRKGTSYLSFNNSIVQGLLKSKGKGRGPLASLLVKRTVDTIYRIILSVNPAPVSTEQWQLYAKNGEPVILMGQSIVLGEVKAETPLHNEKSHE